MSDNTMSEEYISPEYAESLRERQDRHDRHQAMLQMHKDAKQERREKHRRTHGKVKPYCGNLY